MPEHNPRVAVAGCGYWGKNLVRNFHELGALAAVTDTNPPLAEEIAAKHDSVSRPWQDILADPAINGVVLATPAKAHAKMCEAAMRARQACVRGKAPGVAPGGGRGLVPAVR